RISELSGEGSLFPDLSSLTSMEKLMLRSCNITGTIPSYISTMSKLKQLDLSFNNLEGEIPDDLKGLSNVEKLYLTGNSLNGSVPDWIRNGVDRRLKKEELTRVSVWVKLRDVPMAAFIVDGLSAIATKIFKSLILDSFTTYYSVHINCAGPEVTIGNKVFEDDQDLGGDTKFIPANNRWGYSNTGYPWDTNVTIADYTRTNVSELTMNGYELYTKARHSSLSLTYYGRCLANGNYTVTLYFAEIVFRDNRSFHSLGRRVFDVYVQEYQLKNFDIMNEAGGVDKEVIKEIKNVCVTNNTLEIRFQYAGGGTTNVPRRGEYGPIISAISMSSEFKPPVNGKTRKFITVGVVALLCLTLILLGIAWQRGYIGDRRKTDLQGLDVHTGIFTYRQIQAATDNFADSKWFWIRIQ
ncbi:probable LRR receptor-like serine/threonine-protein kinase isoform X1, partial [Tanacetum coccineum]